MTETENNRSAMNSNTDSQSQGKGLLNFLAEKRASNRLYNAIEKAQMRGELQYTSVEEIADNLPRALDHVASLRAIGMTSVRELERLIAQYGESDFNTAESKVQYSLFETEHEAAQLRGVRYLHNDIDLFLRDVDASPRLTNAVANALKSGYLPYRTAAEAIKDYPLSVRKIAKFRNIGQKSLDELEAIFRQYSSIVSSASSESYDAQAEDTSDPQLPTCATVRQIVVAANSTTRLRNALELTSFGDDPVTKFSECKYDWLNELKNTKRAGSKTLAEFVSICTRYSDYLPNTTSAKDNGSVARRSYVEPPDYAIATSLREAREMSSSSRDFNHAVLGWLNALKERQARIIKQRYGLIGRVRTLDDLGREEGVTRERIRQIESKALKKLRNRLFCRQPLIDELYFWFESFWDDGRPFLGKGIDASTIYETCTEYWPGLRLTLDVLGISVDEFLAKHAVYFGCGWFSGNESEDELLRVESVLNTSLEVLEQPVSISLWLQEKYELDPEIVAVVSHLSNSLYFYAGYFSSSQFTKRRIRAMRVRGLITGERQMFNLHLVHSDYVNTYADDQCSARDLIVSIAAHGHWFLPIYGDNWCVLSQSPLPTVVNDRIEASNEPSSHQTATCGDSRVDETTLRHIIFGILESEGPLSYLALENRVMERSSGKHSSHSVGPVIGMEDRIVRVLPGVYALREQSNYQDLAYFRNSMLINESQAKLYAYAKHANEPDEAYPFWSPDFEQAVLEWAYFQSSEQLVASLLAIAKPERWNTNEHKSVLWSQRKRTYGLFRLQRNRPAKLTVPARFGFRRFLAGAIFALNHGRISWISANNVLGLRPDSTTGLALLGWLVRMNMVSNPLDPYAEHTLTSDARGVVEYLEHQTVPYKASFELDAIDAFFPDEYDDRGWFNGNLLNLVDDENGLPDDSGFREKEIGNMENTPDDGLFDGILIDDLLGEI